jgi:hypothetical protein
MLKDLLPVALGGFFTILGGGAVALLTNWLANKSQERARVRELRLAQRDHVVEVIDAGRGWATSLKSASLLLGTIRDPVALVEASGMVEHNLKVSRYHRALNAADLVLVDSELHAKARELAKHYADQASITAPVVTTTQGIGRATNEQMQALWTYCDDHMSMLDRFVGLARQRLVSSAETPRAVGSAAIDNE